MTDTAIHVNQVWKKFRRGEFHDSLRDLIPAMARRAIGRGAKRDKLADQEFWALRDVSFDVKRGESLGIIGPNGSGKSTMLKLLSRIIRPNRGDYKVNGRLSALIEVGAGFHPDLTGRENILLNGTILGMSRREILGKIDQIIDFAGIPDFIDTPVKRYSSGMTARLGFSVAAHLDPEVLLVDEVLSVGDAKFRNKCIRHMHELVKSDVTVVFISHLLHQVRTLCPQTLVLDKGGVVYRGQTDEAIKTYLDLLGDDSADMHSDVDRHRDAEIRNIALLDEDGNEQLRWHIHRPGVIAFDLTLHNPVDQPSVLINLLDIGGAYLGTANSRRAGLELPDQPGTYRVQFALDPMPLANGDYMLELVVRDGPDQEHLLWQIRHPYMVTVDGSKYLGDMITCDGRWEMIDAHPNADATKTYNKRHAKSFTPHRDVADQPDRAG